MDVVLKSKSWQKARQGEKNKLCLNRLHDIIYRWLAKTKIILFMIYPCLADLFCIVNGALVYFFHAYVNYVMLITMYLGLFFDCVANYK